MIEKLKRLVGELVLLEWLDASLGIDWHEKSEPACVGILLNETVGWVRCVDDAKVELYSCRVADGSNVSLIMNIPLACVQSVRKLEKE